jgi:hypothetical protein
MRDEFSRSVFPKTLPQLHARVEAAKPFWRKPVFTVLVPVLAVGAAALMFVDAGMLSRALRPSSGESSGLGIKGGPGFQIFVRHGGADGQVAPVKGGERLAPGDEIRFVAVPAEKKHLLVASIDGRGKVSVYFPFGGSQSGKLDQGGRMELPGSVVLDDAPGPERIFAVFSDEPVAAAEVATKLQALGSKGPDAIRKQGSLAISGSAQVSVAFEKTTP